MVPWKDIFNPNSKIIVKRKTTRLDMPLDAYRRQGISVVENKNTWVKTIFDKPIIMKPKLLRC